MIIHDLEIIQKIRSGRREAYADLVRKYQARVMRLCVSMLSDPAEAEDAAQEIFFKAYRSLDRFRGGSSFFTWLYRIAVNHCRDLLRQQARRMTESWETLLEKEGEKIRDLISVSPEAARSTEETERVRRVLSHLSPDHREILILREIEGLSYQELGETLEASLDAVKGRLRRAREEFEKMLRHFLEGGNV